MMQNNQKIIIITGSIGTGKSTAVDIIKEKGFVVLDSDKIVHEGYEPGKNMYKSVVGFFGRRILNDDETINRAVLGNIVFNDGKSLEKLNEIVHIFVTQKLMEGASKCVESVVFLDIPLALEQLDNLKKNGLRYDEVWLVYTSSDIQRDRLRIRAISENKNPDDVLRIMEKQTAIEKKVDMVDEVINNEGTVEDLRRNVNALLEKKGLI